MGAVAYFLLTGSTCSRPATVLEVCSKHMLEKPVPPSERLGKPLPADLEALVLACLAKDRADRPASAAVASRRAARLRGRGRYDVAASRAWWVRHRTQPEAGTPAPLTGHEATMAIDLARATRAPKRGREAISRPNDAHARRCVRKTRRARRAPVGGSSVECNFV